MKKQHSNIDGFIPRRSGDRLGGLRPNTLKRGNIEVPKKQSINLSTSLREKSQPLGQVRASAYFGRSDVDDSLNIIDNFSEPKKKISRRQHRRMEKNAKKSHSRVRKIIKLVIILIIVAIISVGGYTMYKFISAGGNVFQGNILAIFNSKPLVQDLNGRSNFLILGTSEDDPGHDGASLTDSILVVSVDQNKKNVYMFSVPRDLNVDYGMACNAGYSGKINEYFGCSNSGTTKEDEQDRLVKTQKLVGDVFGINIQYGAHVNYTVLRDVINAIGGSITVNIESVDPRGQMDSNADWKCGNTYSQRISNCPPSGHYIDYPNGKVTIDAEHALYLAMARGHEEPTYGFPRSNPDREVNQQKILIAIRDKAMTAGTLTNLGAITSLIDALGNNLRTNVQTNEIQTIMKIASDINSGDIHSLDLIVDGVMAGDGNPISGDFQYDAIQAYIAKNLSSNPVVREAAPIVVLNGSGQSGFGKTKADLLIADGYNITLIDNAPDGTYDEVEVYQIGTKSSETAKKLASIYDVTLKTTSPPVAVNGDVQFVIIFGTTAS